MSTVSSKIFSVSELTAAIKSHLEPKFFQISLKGEITNFTKQASGHLYFSLKDEQSQISSVLFKGAAAQLTRVPKAGDKVIVRGSLSVYAPRGSYQLIISELQYEGLGDLLLKLHELKEKFHKKGYFETQRKKPLPAFPKTIGVVTSPTGAVIHDILTVLSRRCKGFSLILNPVKVQGPGAEKEIAAAIEDFNRFGLVDVMIVGRGGGSLEDLWAFNEECVVEAIYHSKIPIISSVGHETDICLSDFVADVRAPTPSAAAEMVMKERNQQVDFLDKAFKAVTFHAKQHLQHHRFKLNSMTRQKVIASPDHLLAPFFQKIDDKIEQIPTKILSQLQMNSLRIEAVKKRLSSLAPIRKLEYFREKNKFFETRLDDLAKAKVELLKTKILKIKDLLDAIHPQHILKKGYCIPFAENKASVIISAQDTKVHETVILQFHDGQITTTVTKDIHGSSIV